MTQQSDTKYKIQVIVNGNPLTFNGCKILDETDPTFLKFSDKFNVVLRYNKDVVISMEELK
jgi:hypothetical protein